MPGSLSATEVAIDAVSSVASPPQGNNNAGVADTTAPAQATPKSAAPPSPKSVSYEVAGAPTPGGSAPTPAARSSADVCSSLRETSVSSRSLSKGVGVLGKVVSTKRLTRQLSSSSNLVTKYKDPGVKLGSGKKRVRVVASVTSFFTSGAGPVSRARAVYFIVINLGGRRGNNKS